MRQEKFGSLAASTEDKSVLEERRRKFGKAEGNVSLSDEIGKNKNKPINKPHKKFRGRPKHLNNPNRTHQFHPKNKMFYGKR